MSDRRTVAPSAFSERLNAAIDRLESVLPLHLRAQFREEFAGFGDAHDRTMSTIEDIWQRRDRHLSFDEATGLARRRPFRDRLARMLAAPDALAFSAVGVLFIDIDNLKNVNDTYGHRTGDRALAAVGRAIRDAIRGDRDTDVSTRAVAEDDDYSVSRHGGDEFLVALELRDPAGIEVVAPRIRRHVEDPERQKAGGYDGPLPITVSVGGVVVDVPGPSPRFPPQALARELIAAADEQMYLAKRDRRIHIVPVRITDRIEIDRAHARTLESV